jgi:prepilin-type N-terminal cleavage/methylation domain-containing protein
MKGFHIKESRWDAGFSPTSGEGFSLLELVIVMAIMGLLAWMLLPAIQGMKSGGDLTKNTSELQSVLSQARAQAMLKDCYVYVGFYESDGTRSDSIRPAPSGAGRVWVGVAAIKDGTQGYSSASNGSNWNSANLMPAGKLRCFESLHLSTNAPFYSASIKSNTVSPIGDSSATNTPFGWPIENSNTITGFTTGVIEFTPQGMAMLPGSSVSPEYIQIALIPSHGNQVMSNSSNAAVLLVDAITGSVSTFRP